MIFLLIPILGLLVYAEMNKGQVTSVIDDVESTVVEYTDSWTLYDALFQKYGSQYGVDWQWLKAFALNESDLGRNSSVATGLADPTDVEGSASSDGKSWGLMQVTLTTGSDYDSEITPEKLNNPEYSIDIAAQLIKDIKKQFSSFDTRYLESVVKSYNQGAGNTRKEMAGTIAGYTGDYWPRWQRNYNKVKAG